MLDLTPAGGVASERVTANLVRGAVARAAGQLRVFSLYKSGSDTDFLVNLLWSAGAELQQLHTNIWLSVEKVDEVFDAAPRLQVLTAQVSGHCTELLSALRNEPLYGPLRVSALEVGRPEQSSRRAEDAAEFATQVYALAAAVAAHESLKRLSLWELVDVQYATGLNALVDAAAQRRLSCLEIEGCALDSESIPALARLLREGSLTKLEVRFCPGFPHAQEASMPVLCAALRACRTLKYLVLCLNPPNGATHRNVTELLDAVATLPALAVLDLCGSSVQFYDETAAGRALGAFLGANLPSLPAVRTNMSLRKLQSAHELYSRPPAADKADTLVYRWAHRR